MIHYDNLTPAVIRVALGRDRVVASAAMSALVGDTTLTGNQLAFVNLIIDQLTQRGAVNLTLLYEALFTGYAPTGPDGLFTNAHVTALIAVLHRVTATAEAS